MPVRVTLLHDAPNELTYMVYAQVVFPPDLEPRADAVRGSVCIHWDLNDFRYVQGSGVPTPDRVEHYDQGRRGRAYWASRPNGTVAVRLRCQRRNQAVRVDAASGPENADLPGSGVVDVDSATCACGFPADIGVGLVGQKFMGRAHSNAWSQVGRFGKLAASSQQRAVTASDRSLLAHFAKRWGWESAEPSVEQLLAREDVQLVDLATPNHLHREHAVAALKAGKHVACEKPLAGSFEDARAMHIAAQKAAKKGLRTFVWFNYRHCPAVAFARALVTQGLLGPLRHCRARYLQSWGGADTPMSWRFERKLAGSGAHGDLNAHLVDLARFLTGEELSEVNGALEGNFVSKRAVPGARSKRKADVDDSFAFLARFESGATASFEASRVAPGHLNDMGIELNGERGSLRFSFERMNELEFFDATAQVERSGWTLISCTGANFPLAGQWWPEGHVLGYEHSFVHVAADILRVLSGAAPSVPVADFADAYQTQRVLEAALRSARTRKAIKLSSVR